MIISITGTPGTGKTEVSRLLSEELGLPLHTVKDLASEHNLFSGYDVERESRIVDTEKLAEKVKGMGEDKDIIIDGHLSHLLNPHRVFLLRTHPEELKKRLKEKDWNEKKIKENVEAEMIGKIKVEALDTEAEVFEVDTSGKSAKETLKTIRKIMKYPDRHKTSVDWLGDENER